MIDLFVTTFLAGAFFTAAALVDTLLVTTFLAVAFFS